MSFSNPERPIAGAGGALALDPPIVVWPGTGGGGGGTADELLRPTLFPIGGGGGGGGGPLFMSQFKL